MPAYYNEHDPDAAAWIRELIRDGLVAPGDVDVRSIVDVQPEDLRGYTQCHFFAGIAGWSAALRLAGWGDDRAVWTGSCPCQPFSPAGKQKGQEDERHLWPDFFRLIRECRPDVVLGEQVEGAIRHGWLDGVQADLEGEGYAVGHCVLGAHSVGAPHIRQRLYWGAVRLGNTAGQRLREAGAAVTYRGTADMPSSSVSTHRLADAERDGGRVNEPQRGAERRAADGRACAGTGDAIGWLEHSPSDGRQQRRAEPDGRGTASGCGDAGERMGDADGKREGSQRGVSEGARVERGGSSHWSDFRIVHCRDGKARRVPEAQSGFQFVADGLSGDLDAVRAACESRFPLAGKIPNRVMLLRGAGNAIVPQAAAAFIEAFEESMK